MTGSKVFVVVFCVTAVVVVLAIVMRAWLASVAKKAELAKATDGEYRRLASEYRRIAELAVTAQEHTDLKLEDLGMRLDVVHGQLESVQQVLKEVE
jgi:Tfp pilus assembly protein PilO